MTKILFVISRFLDGGIDTVLVEVLRMLAGDARYELTLAVGVKMEGLEVYRGRVPEGVKVVHVVGEHWLCAPRRRRFLKQAGRAEAVMDELLLNPVRRWLTGRRLRRLAAEADVVVDFDACQTSFLRGCGRPVAAWLHFSPAKLMEQNGRRLRRIARRMEGYDCVVLICRAMQEEAERLLPGLCGRTRFIYNALEPSAFRLEGRPACPCPYIVAVERLEESQKDLRTLLRAYAMMGDVEERLVIVGKGKDEGLLRDCARELGVENRVVFAGFQENAHAWMAEARLVVHSAKFEGLPTVLIEALLLGKVVVATDCPTGPAEILDDGRAGVLVPVGDAEAMASAMRRMLRDEDERQRVLRYAAVHSRRFTAECVKPQLDELFASLR